MVSDLTTFAHKGCKIAVAKKVFTDFFDLFALFQRLFAPLSQSAMSKLFRFSESLVKSNGKKWCQIWKLLHVKGVKLPRKKNSFSVNFALVGGFFWYQCYYPHQSWDADPVCRIFKKLFEFNLIGAIISTHWEIQCLTGFVCYPHMLIFFVVSCLHSKS